MDLTWSAEEEAFRAEVRAWLAANVPEGLPSGDTAAGFTAHLEWERRLFAARWAVVSWPERFGGRDVSPWEWLIFEEEYHRAGAPSRVTQNGIFLLAPAVFTFGTSAQQERILPRMAAAEDLWCQGWSEPGAGSDLAAVQSRATKVEGGWRLSGQKTWTTRGAFCTHLFGLFRSDPHAERHRGLTYLLVPLDTPGIAVRGFGRLDGDEGFAEVFFDDAFLPDESPLGGAVLGEVGGGWRVAMATAGSERGLTLRSPGRFLATAERLVELCRRHDPQPSPALVDRVVRCVMRARAYDAFTLQAVTATLDGSAEDAAASLNKIWWSELDVALHECALDLLGPLAELEGPWSKGWQFALGGPIYAGTNEIQRNVAADRLLGLPRFMRFSFTAEQLELRDAVRDVLAKECPPAVVRAAWDAPAGRLDRGPFRALAEMGVLDVLVPAAEGGLGLDYCSLVLVLEETGRVALPHPVVESAAVAAPLLGHRLAGRMAGVCLAGDPVACAGDLDLLVVDDGSALRLAAHGQFDVEPLEAVDRGRRLGRVVRVPRDADVLADDAARAAAFDRAALGTAAQLLGLAETMLELAVRHVRDRRQFGVPVGSFQAVRHQLVDCLTELAFARPSVYRAAWSVAHDLPGRADDVSTAKALASDAAVFVARRALQCHGALGYTVEHDLHLYLKRAWALARAYGDAGWHRRRVAAAMGLTAGATEEGP